MKCYAGCRGECRCYPLPVDDLKSDCAFLGYDYRREISVPEINGDLFSLYFGDLTSPPLNVREFSTDIGDELACFEFSHSRSPCWLILLADFPASESTLEFGIAEAVELGFGLGGDDFGDWFAGRTGEGDGEMGHFLSPLAGSSSLPITPLTPI